MTPHRTPTTPPDVTVHVDGACHPNPGRGGWGAVLRSGPHEKRISGRVPERETTNQRAELWAALQALCALKVPCRVAVYSDSQYLVKSMNVEYSRRTNLDLWEPLDEIAALHVVTWIWKRGQHEGEGDNAIAHRLAEAEVSDQDEEQEICEPRYFGDDGPYYCARLLSRRNLASREERCPGGTFFCTNCADDVAEFITAAYNATAVEQEWEED